MVLLRRGALVKDDPWVFLGDDAPLDGCRHAVVTFSRWQKEGQELSAKLSPRHVGVMLMGEEHADAIEVLGASCHGVGIIVLSMPAFRDGRVFSAARQLRERFGYGGELRVKGHVLPDQLYFLHRCGVDSFEGDERLSVRAWERAMSSFSYVYQPTWDRRPTVMAQRHASTRGDKGGDKQQQRHKKKAQALRENLHKRKHYARQKGVKTTP
ncbi:MAG: DUF934 domain-containing protein [Alphaproteobacteria bacterium GM7ARS4]|nr:DUF934 domain-containing protein [Alphaproteobacteria bacterium GM7ARS4]